MTKDELYARMLDTKYNLKEELDSFFEQNVCIPKGENRHKDADVLHQMAEGIEAEFSSDNGDTWVGVSRDLYYCESYRIKLLEPIYEYKWSVNEILIYTVTDKFYTDEEISKVVGFTFTKLIDTKQEREQP